MDAIVIGAGIIGSSIAWRLAQRGLKVALLDAGAAGGEASWAGAGMLAPGGEIGERNDWSDFALRSRALYPGFVEELRETGVPIDFQPNGAIEAVILAGINNIESSHPEHHRPTEYYRKPAQFASHGQPPTHRG